MTNPTTPFSWQMPTSTDLVTDLPADFETFGQAVATSMADLLGGTTGQVLSKASNTDMDFTWVTSDDTNAIQNAIVDAKGDLIGATAADTPARLAVGTNGQVLTADSTAATGLAWATPTSGGMTLLSTTTLSGASTTLSSISSAYTDLYLVIQAPRCATGGGLQVAVNAGSGNAIGAGTYVVRPTPSAYINNFGYAGNTGGGTIKANNDEASFAMTLNHYATGTNYRPYQFYGGWINPSDVWQAINYAGVMTLGGTITSIVLSNSAGNWTGGTVYLYGVK